MGKKVYEHIYTIDMQYIKKWFTYVEKWDTHGEKCDVMELWHCFPW